MGHEDRKRMLEEIPRALRAFLSASDAFDEVLGNVLGLNPTDVRCVDLLDQYGTMTAGALAEVAGLSTGAVTFLLDRLERAGFVRRVRDLEDRRRVLVELLPQARTLISELHAGLRQGLRTSASRILRRRSWEHRRLSPRRCQALRDPGPGCLRSGPFGERLTYCRRQGGRQGGPESPG